MPLYWRVALTTRVKTMARRTMKLCHLMRTMTFGAALFSAVPAYAQSAERETDDATALAEKLQNPIGD